MKTFTRALVAITVLGAAPAFAATTITSSISVTASVSANCTFAATPSTAVAFGTYDTLAGAPTATGTIVARCTKNTAYTLALGVGAGAGASYTGRFMTGAVTSDLLGYNLFTTAGLATVFGDGTGATSTVGGTGTGFGVAFNQTTNVFGRIPALQNVSADTYSDTVVVSLTY